MRQISVETAEWFRAACDDGVLSRSALAREFCLRDGWFDSSDRLCVASARKLLPRLARELGVRLPTAEGPRMDSHARPASDFPDNSVSRTLRDLGPLSLELVTDPEERRRWEAMIETHHPEGWRRPPGGQVRYWVRSERSGVLGGVGFTAAGIQLGPRDDVIGWSADARVANIGKVVCNHRFLLLPGVRVKGLASRVLRLSTDRIADDWAAAYRKRPNLVQSFTGPGQSGLSYRAAGWTCCPKLTSGRRSGVHRTVWIKPLADDWQQDLCIEPKRTLGWSGSFYSTGGWAAREYGRSPHPDGRIRRRMVLMGEAWRLGERLSSIFPEQAERIAAYRLLSNDAVTKDHILESHFEQTVERCQAERLVLAVQGTTTLNYHSNSPGLDESGDKGNPAIRVRFGLAVNSVGQLLGMYMFDTDFRQDRDNAVVCLDRAQELARACPDSRVVTVSDCEGDFREMLSRAQQTGASVLVSSGLQHRVALTSGEDVWHQVLETEPVGVREIEVPACCGDRRRGNTAKLTLRCTMVNLLSPQDRGSPLRMIAVSALEEDPLLCPKNKPLHWMLLTSEDQADLDTACRVLRWYESHWCIERFFNVLQAGMCIKSRHLDQVNDTGKCLAFDAITAFRDLSSPACEKTDDPAMSSGTKSERSAFWQSGPGRNGTVED